MPDFFLVDTYSHKLKIVKNFLVGHCQNRCGQSGHGTLKVTVFQE